MPESGQDSESIDQDTEDSEKYLGSLTAFLIADLEHFGQSLLQNEQMGEGRFRFFLTIITAVSAGLVTLYTAKGNLISKEDFPYIVNGALLGLMFFGFLTYLRMLQRDRVSAGYRKDLKHIRSHLSTALKLEGYKMAESGPSFTEGWWQDNLRAGYSQLVGAVFSLLIAVLAFYNLQLFLECGAGISIIGAVLVFGFSLVITLWVAAHNRKAAQDAR